jgi:chromosome segregation ATPase
MAQNLNLDRNLTYHVITQGSISTGETAGSGKSKANGNYGDSAADGLGEPIGGKMLVGELGNEILVNRVTGKWHTVGDNGAEFVNVGKGDIIFNHEQTKDLLNRGWVNGRGTTGLSRANGTARSPGTVTSSGTKWSYGNGSYGSKSSSKSSGSTSSGSTSKEAKDTEKTILNDQKKFLSNQKQALEDQKEGLENEKEALEDQKTILEDQKKVFEKQRDIYKDTLSAIDDAIDKEIDRLDTMYDAQKKVLEQAQTDMDNSLSAVNYLIETKIDDLTQAQTALEDKYQPNIDAIQTQIDALNDQNDAQKEAIELAKKKAALEDAQRTKTIRVYREGKGYVWEADQSAIQSAQEDYNDALNTKRVNDLTKQKDAMEKELSDKKQALQDQIDAYNDYKDKWNKVSDQFKNADNIETLKQMYGSDVVDKILNQDSGILDKLSEDYYKNQSDQKALNAAIAKNEETIEQLKAIKKNWDEVADDYEKNQQRINAAATLGADWEKIALEGRIENISAFRDKYNGILSDIAAKEEEITAKEEEIASKEKEITAKSKEISAKDKEVQAVSDQISDLTSTSKSSTTNSYASGTDGVPETQAARIDEVGDEIVVRNIKGAHYSVLTKGTGVIPATPTRTLLDLANNPSDFIAKYMTVKVPTQSAQYTAAVNQGVTIQNVNIEMNEVNDVDTFGKVIQEHLGTVIAQATSKR